MTDHIVSFSVGIDDDAIKKNVEDLATKQIINDIKKGIINKVFGMKRYGVQPTTTDGFGNIKLSSDAELSDISKQIIKDAIEEFRDEIISEAAKMLANNYARTKAWKDKAGEVTK